MKKFYVLAVLALLSSTGAYAVGPAAANRLAASCCSVFGACCEAVMACCG